MTSSRSRTRRDRIMVAVAALVVAALGLYLAVRDRAPDADPAADSMASAASNAPSDPARSTADPAPSDTASNPAASQVPTSSAPSPGASTPTGRTSSAATPTTDTSPRSIGIKRKNLGPLGKLTRDQPGDPRALGRVDAPVAMVIFSDFRCPFCAQFSRNTERQVIDTYVKSGKLRVEWRDFPLFGDQSARAAIAGQAAAAQGRFWQFTHALFADAPAKGHLTITQAKLVGWAKQAGVPDIAKFTKALSDPALTKKVETDLTFASNIGVPSTPSFAINGHPLVGAQPFANFRAVIDRALRGA